jgi:hypothetical protein
LWRMRSKPARMATGSVKADRLRGLSLYRFKKQIVAER